MRDTGDIGADIAETIDAQAEEAAALAERQLRAPERVAALVVGNESFRTGRDPMDRLSKRARGVQHGPVFRIAPALHAEGAAKIAGEDAQLLRLDVHGAGDLAAHGGNSLQIGRASCRERVSLTV